MIIEFKASNKNTYGRRNYLGFDTDKKIYTTNCGRIVIPGIEIRTRDYKDFIQSLIKEGYTEVETI